MGTPEAMLVCLVKDLLPEGIQELGFMCPKGDQAQALDHSGQDAQAAESNPWTGHGCGCEWSRAISILNICHL